MQLKLNSVVCQGLCTKVDGLAWSEIWWCEVPSKPAHFLFCTMSSQQTESNSQNQEQDESKEINLPSHLPSPSGNLAYDSIQVRQTFVFLLKSRWRMTMDGCLECITCYCHSVCASKSASWHCSWSRNRYHSWLFSACVPSFIPCSNCWPVFLKQKTAPIKAGNWAVATFALTSIASW